MFLTVAIAFTAIAASAQTDGFSYQAVVRNSKGELVSNKSVGIRLTIANSDGSNVMYSETQTAQTNAYGVLSVTVGSGTPQNGGSLSNVNWAGGQAWLHVGIDVNGGSSYTSLGATKIQAVPVALYAARSGNRSQNGGVNNPTDSGDALFEVKDNDGNVVFAVYPNEVRVYVDENDSKVKRSGLIVTGRNTKGDSEKDYLIVNPTGTQVFVDENDGKAKRSGLIVTGRNTKGDVEQDYLVVNPNGTKVIVDEGDGKVKRSGLVVTGRNTKGDGEQDYLVVDPSGTQVIVDDELDNDSKAPRSGFVVTGRNTKDDNPTKYLKVATDGTLMHFDKSDAKVKRSGLIVTGRNTKGTDEEYFNIDAAQDAKIINNENRIYWYPEKNAFMAGNLKIEHPDSVGTNSFNAGYQNKASGEYSQALGYMSVAKGDYTTAIGRKANAEADRSYAFGDSAQAQGVGSYAFGAGAIATGISSFAFGSEGRDSIDEYNPNVYVVPAKATGNYAYAIGAGTEASARGSLAMGVNSKAGGANSVAIGSSAEAYGDCSVAIGVLTKADFNSTALGQWTSSKGAGSISMGMGTKTGANGGAACTSMGAFTSADLWCSTAMGNNTNASGHISTAMGLGTKAKGAVTTTMGWNTIAQKVYEVVIGSCNDTIVGNFGNEDYEWKDSDRLFVIGNGTSVKKRSNAMVIYKNGNTEFRGNLYPAVTKYDWQNEDEIPIYSLGTNTNRWSTVFANTINATNGEIQTSDQRLKTNIKPLEKALDKVLTLNGVTYEWRVNEFPEMHFDSNRHVGVIAQEVEAVLPEAVETSDAGYKSVNYSNITPLLIEAIKEQQAEIEELKSVKEENEALKAKVEKLEKMMEELLNKQ